MKKEAKLLRQKAVESLILSTEHFNRPSDRGRTEAVLILLDHAFEMLLKAAILHKGGRIREKTDKQTIGFDHCVRKAVSDGDVKFLNEEEALVLQAINGLRDAAQHHLVDVSERHLYLQAQAGLGLFRSIFESVFSEELRTQLPERVLPVATSAPADLATLFDLEAKEIQALLKPGTRRGVEANAKLRSLAIVDSAFSGEKVQPSEGELRKPASKLASGKAWDKVFEGVAAINLTTTGFGPSIDLRITKTEGSPPVTLVPEGTPGATTVAVKRVDELGFYSMGRDQLAEKIGLSGPKTTALVRHLRLKEDAECFKEVVIGRSKFARYSQKAFHKLETALRTVDMDLVWKEHGNAKEKDS